ncbi:hypothetical protein KY285_010670 [Solanum tuberosum]|nr:hypothetical protein KY285_010670 [Solanum tuberosum]
MSENECATSSRADSDKDLAVVTRSGNITVDNVKVNDGKNAHEEEKDIVEEESSVQASENEMLKEKEESP